MANDPSALPSIGERLQQLRLQRQPSMTQRELAERAGVSIDLVRKLEQGVKQTALLATLHKLAAALDVNVSTLIASPARIDTINDNDLDDADRDRGILAIREAIIARWDDAEPAPLDELRQSARYAWECYWTNRFDTLGTLLPAFIAGARASARETDDTVAYAELSDGYVVAASMVVHLGHIDLGYLAMERAITAAERSGDELRHAATLGWMSWVLLHQTGVADRARDSAASSRAPLQQARQLAVAQADRIEPKLSNGSPEQISVWGRLLVDAAVASARDGLPDEADNILNLAEAAAIRLEGTVPPVRLDYQSPFGRPLVVMQQVDAAVITARPGRALQVAKRMPPDAPLPLASKGRHLADVASAQTSLGHDNQAVETLLRIEAVAPRWMHYQPYPRTIVRELLERKRRAGSRRLRELAGRLGVA